MKINEIRILIQIHSAHGKLFLSVFSLLLLAIVTYSGAFMKESYAASNTHIIAAGDWGCSKNTEDTIKLAQSMNPQLLLALGDFSYEKTATCWLDLIKPLDSITKINIGNHEVESDGLVNTYLSHYGLPKQFYSYDIKNVHVLTMSTEEKPKTDSEQYSFVVNDLRNAANNPDIKWIIISMHYPFYASPNTCKESDCAGNEEYRDIYHPLFDRYGVDLVLQGHVHNYQRSYPLNFNQQSSSNPLVTSTSKVNYENPNGVIFAIVGTGGVNLHGLSGSASFMAYQQDSKFGILDMHFSDNKLDAKFVTTDGAPLDHFSISKTAKKKIIERISDNINSDTKSKEISYKDEAKTKPLIEKDQNGKPAITFKDEKAVAITDKTKPKTDELKVQEDKPAVTFKDENAAAATDKMQPKTDELKVQEDKPAVTFKLDENAAAATDKNENAAAATDKMQPKTDELKVQKDKPATTTKLGNDQPKDDKSMLVSEQKIEQADSNNNNNNNNNKPAMTPKLSNDPQTDDKPISQNGHDKSESSDQGKITNDKPPVGGFDQQKGNTEQTDNNEFVDPDTDTDSDTGTDINTNEKDPFAPLK
jgi:predicted MPP superfamily phosphohydrolase